MPQPTQGLTQAARTHLQIMKAKRTVPLTEARLYVGLAFTYGLSVYEISAESGIALDGVQRILGGS